MPQYHSDYATAIGMALYLLRLRQQYEVADVDYIDMTDAPITDPSRLLPEHTIIL